MKRRWTITLMQDGAIWTAVLDPAEEAGIFIINGTSPSVALGRIGALVDGLIKRIESVDTALAEAGKETT